MKYPPEVFVFTIDDGRHGEDDTIAIPDDRIDWFVSDDGKVVTYMTVCRIHLHQLHSCVFLGLNERRSKRI